VSYEFLSQLVAEYLLLNCPDVDISAALSIMPQTQTGMDLNPQFTGPKSFRPAAEGGELQLFEQVGIDLYHGWLVDPDSPEARVVQRWSDYDSAVTLIADADHTAKGQLVIDDSEIPQASGSGSSSAASPFTENERQKIEDGKQVSYHFILTSC
jgi:ubiquitin carboxyl-terminal hydrolase MINDY-1/2